MEHMTLTNVRQRGNDHIYRLVFAAEGLYLIHMTNEEGLNNYHGGSIEYRAEGKEGNDIIDSLAAGAEVLSDDMSRQLLDDVNSRFYAWGQLEDVRFSAGEPPTLRLQANDNDYEFIFPHTPSERLDAFVGKLRERFELEQAGQREMRRQ